ncbi:MAG: 4Fe-4S binding protein [bacterium]
MSNTKIEIDENRCDFCGVCVGVCSSSAIIMKENNIFVNNENCGYCYWCFDACPVGAIVINERVKNVA